jgi:hypothetical protein
MNEQIIYKYRVEVGEHVDVPWREGTRVTHSRVDLHPGWVTFWCVHPLATDPTTVRIEVMPTGQPFPADYEVLSTATHADSGLVWHLVRVNPR